MKHTERLRDRPQWVLDHIAAQRTVDTAEPIAMAPRMMPPPASLDPYTGTMTDGHIAHLLRRTLFGFTMEDLRHFRGQSLSQILDTLFQEQTVPEEPVNDYVDSGQGESDPQVAYGESWVNHTYDGDWESGRTVSYKVWWLRQMLEQPRSIHMRMHFFLHHILVTQSWDTFYGKLSYRYWKTLFDHCFSDYRSLMKAITKDAAMLGYLNGNQNSKEAPDENYARELQELFCIGKGPDAAYTEADVQMAAKVLTGWKTSWPEAEVGFGAWDHDTSDKTFSAFYGGHTIRGRVGQAGAEETDELIDMILDNDEAAAYLARRLYQFFVFPEISEEVERDIIQPLAVVIRDNDFQLAAALKVLLASEHFMLNEVRGAIIKSPVDHIVGAFKVLEVDWSAGDDLHYRFVRNRALLWNMSDGGMEIGDPPSVSGWPAHYQAPLYDQAWINTTTVVRRALDTDSLLYWGLWSPVENYFADYLAYARTLDNPQDPNALIADTAMLIYGIAIDAETSTRLKDILLSGQSTDDYWTIAWLEYIADPDDEMKRSLVVNRLRYLLQIMFQSGEYHLG